MRISDWSSDVCSSDLARAKADGFGVKAPADAVSDAELIAVLTPDMVQAQLYREVIEPNVAPGACLLFAHGFNVHYDQIDPRADLDVVLVAPTGPRSEERRVGEECGSTCSTRWSR